MKARKLAEIFQEEWEGRGQRGDRVPSSEASEAPEAVKQAYETARRLAEANYSHESRVRQALKQRLMSIEITEGKSERAFTLGRLSNFARFAAWAAVVLVLALALIWALNTLIPRPVPGVLGTPSIEAVKSESANHGQLAYVQGGDVWVKRLPDGEAQQLTKEGLNMQPRWSPSGEWLAYRHGEDQLWVINADGSQRYQLPGSVSPEAFAWSPAADRLAYVDGMKELLLVEPGGEPQTLVSSPERHTIPYIAWSPDGAWIAFQWQVPPLDPVPAYRSLWKVSADGGEPVELFSETSDQLQTGVYRLAGWTSDGDNLIFWGGNPFFSASLGADGVPLYLLSSNGGKPQQLAEASLLYEDYVRPDPAGKGEIAMVMGGGREAWSNKGLYRFDGTESIPLTGPDFAVASPAWSPDGARIAYVQMPEAGNLAGGEPARQALMRRRLWVLDVSTGQSRQLTDDPAYRDEYPLWSKDGSTVLFVRMNEANRLSVWMVPVEDGESQMVVDGLLTDDLSTPESGWFGYYGHIDWSGLFDWWRGPASAPTRPIPTETGERISEDQADAVTTPTPISGILPEGQIPLVKVKPLITAEGLRLRFDSWAPDGLWIAYWLGEEEEQPFSLAFANVDSGETCQHEEVRAQDLGSGQVIWQEDGSVITVLNREGEALGGVPCEMFAPVADVALPDPYTRVDVSPDGRYFAERIILKLEEQAVYTELRITEARTGKTIVSIPYISSPHFVLGGPKWLNDELYLIGKTVDQGLLYYSVPDEKVDNVFPDLLGLEAGDEENVSVIGTQADPGTGEYHLFIGMSDQGSLLYHSELDQTEELPFYHGGSFADASGGWRSFSPNGKWLLLLSDSPGGDGEVDYWLRPVDPPGSSPVQIAGQAGSGGLSSNGQMMAFFRQGTIQIASFPDGRLLSRWHAPNYWLDRLWWSPDGSCLVAYGSHLESGQEALFAIEPFGALNQSMPAEGPETNEPAPDVSQRDAGEVYLLLDRDGYFAAGLVRFPAACLVTGEPCPQPEPVDGFPAGNSLDGPLRWSSDAQQLVYHTAFSKHDLWLFDRRSGNWSDLSVPSLADRHWSPDGAWLLGTPFIYGNATSNPLQLVSLEGEETRRILEDMEGNKTGLGWLDENRILFLQQVDNISPSFHDRIVIFDRITGGHEILADLEYEDWQSRPVMSPDRSRLAFSNRNEGSYRIYVMEVENGSTVSFPFSGHPSVYWSPDGRWLSVGAALGMYCEIHIFRPDGRAAQKIFSGDEGGGCQHTWSPDSRNLLVTEYAQNSAAPRLYLISIPDGKTRLVELPDVGIEFEKPIPFWLP